MYGFWRTLKKSFENIMLNTLYKHKPYLFEKAGDQQFSLHIIIFYGNLYYLLYLIIIINEGNKEHKFLIELVA